MKYLSDLKHKFSFFLSSKRKKKPWLRGLAVLLSVSIVFTTVCTLMLPASAVGDGSEASGYESVTDVQAGENTEGLQAEAPDTEGAADSGEGVPEAGEVPGADVAFAGDLSPENDPSDTAGAEDPDAVSGENDDPNTIPGEDTDPDTVPGEEVNSNDEPADGSNSDETPAEGAGSAEDTDTDETTEGAEELQGNAAGTPSNDSENNTGAAEENNGEEGITEGDGEEGITEGGESETAGENEAETTGEGESETTDGSGEETTTDSETSAEESVPSPEYFIGTLSYEKEGDYSVTVVVNEDAKIPNGASLSVRELEGDEYDAYLALTMDTLPAEEVGSARFFDITIMLDGAEVEPEAPVQVSIVYAKPIEAAQLSEEREVPAVLHFDEEGVEVLSAEVKTIAEVTDVLRSEGSEVPEAESLAEGKDQCALVFTADSFSVYAVVTPSLGELDGETYGILYTQSGTNPRGTAVMSTAVSGSNNTKLQGKSTVVRVEPVNRTENVYVATGVDITMWTFHDAGETNKYFITIGSDENLQYLKISSAGLSLVSDPDDVDADCKITVTAGTGGNAGKFRFRTANGALNTSGSDFARANGAGSWMNLAKRSNLNDDDFVVYTAYKVSVSGTEENGHITYDVNDQDEVVLYTRIWNGTKYDYYAVDHDGMLVKAYESGDTISWVGSKVNTMPWTFTEYKYPDGTPNYYYELQNVYSGKYIAPHIGSEGSNSGILSDGTIGINLNGRRYMEYYSTILAWDAEYYDYAALKVQQGDRWQLVAAPMSNADTFYFAKMKVESGGGSQQEPTEVSTVDHSNYGIELKIQNYPYQGYYIGGGYRSKTQTDILGRNSEASGNSSYPGLLTRYLEDEGENAGYPKTTAKAASAGGQEGTSLHALYNDAMTVNHQFLTGTYNETGYFEYDCTKNFAHLITKTTDKWYGQESPDGSIYDIGDFVVYDQIGTSDLSAKTTLQHGQFLPFNDLTEGQFSRQNPTNETDLYGNYLSSLDPRKGERLYGIPASLSDVNGTQNNPKYPKEGQVDYFFGMEMSASFMQNENGLDDWGHDLIFEFSGDDDFWFYVDGVLILDLGGVHSAIDGSVNFRSGEVKFINGRGTTETTTLRELYTLAFREKYPTASEAALDEYLSEHFKEGTSVFKDYSGHTMKMFYMERGSSASNLRMRFNLAPYTDGEVLLEKEVTGTDNISTRFPFQILIEEKLPGGRYFDFFDDPSKVKDSVTGEAVPYLAAYSAGGFSYSNVFLLKPGQTVSILLPSEDTVYRITECAIDTTVFDTVSANGILDEESIPGSSIKNYTIVESTVQNRKKVIYENHVSEDVLKSLCVTKRLWQEETKTYEILSGTGEGADNTRFKIRVYIGKNDQDNYTPYNTGKYYVKNPAGEYCIYKNGDFVSTGKTNVADLSTVVPTGEWESERDKATFNTSPNGAIDNIKAGYTVEIPGLLAGTPFLIEERDDEIPTGYDRLGYTLTNGAYSAENQGTEENSGTIASDMNAQTVSIHNRHGYGLTAEKIWSDAAFMSSHDPIYFAVYLKGSDAPIAGTVRALEHPTVTARWFFPELASGKTMNDYEVYEVDLTGNNIVVDPDTGAVSGYTGIEKKEGGDSITIGGTSNEQGYSPSQVYTVSYDRETAASDAKSRHDKVKNSRPGLMLVKTDMDGNALENAVFELSGASDGTKTFTSDGEGLIAVAYLVPDREYTLTEITAPYGYRSLISSVTIKVTVDADTGKYRVYVNDSDLDNADGYYIVQQVEHPTAANMPTITIRNKVFALQAVKVDLVSGQPIEGVHFALYRETTEYGTGNPMPYYLPMSGYERLVTDENGIIPKIVMKNSEHPNGLGAGTYYLRETTPTGYKPLGVDVRITITETGQVSVSSAVRPDQTGSWTIRPADESEAVIEELANGTIQVTIKNTPKEPVRIRKLESGTTDKTVEGAEFALYRLDQIDTETGLPKDGETPRTGITDENGLLYLDSLHEDDNITYYLFETKPAPGYNPLTDPIIINLADGNVQAYLNDTELNTQLVEVTASGQTVNVWEITVYNTPGVELPLTGSIGTAPFVSVGAILLLGAGLGLVLKDKFGNDDDKDDSDKD